MSLNEKDAKVPSNEEIIEDLTKNLESQRVFSDECNSQQIGDSDKTNDLKSPIDLDETDEEIKGKRAELEDDFIDEDLLKEAEANLSEDEKLQRKKDAIDLKNKGNEAFKQGDFVVSLNHYTEALKLCPLSYESERAIFYANRAASKAKLDRKVSAIDDCTKAIELNPKYVRAYLRRASLYEDTDKLSESLDDFKKVLEIDPGIPEARAATVRLPPLIEQQNEKLKAEMLGKIVFKQQDTIESS